MRPVICISLILMTAPAIAGDSPQHVLEKHGLRPVNGVWVASHETQIPERMHALERLERRVKEQSKQVEQLLDQNELRKLQHANQTAALKILQEARKSAKGPEQKQLDEQIKNATALAEDLKKAIVPVEKLGGVAPTKAAVMDFVAMRLELALQILKTRRLIERAPAVYESLRKKPEVAAALAALEPDGQLAPPRAYATEQRIIARIERLVFNDEVRFYREGKQLRTTALANEELPITFSFYDKDKQEPTIITHTMAESLGMTLDDKQAKTIRLDGGHNVQAKPARLSSLRFGRHVLKDIEVHVLSPEQENLGARIGRSALKKLRVQMAPERLLLRLEPATENKSG
jgi:hypothetical protein